MGPVLAPNAAASGLLSVKSILAEKVPGSNGGGTPKYNAPQINSTLLTQAQVVLIMVCKVLML